MTKVIQDPSPSEFLKRAGPLLYRNEAVNSLLIGLTENLTAQSPLPRLLRIVDGETLAAGIVTVEGNLILTGMKPHDISVLVDLIAVEIPTLKKVIGPAETSNRFAEIWTAKMGTRSKVSMDQLIYDAHSVIPTQVEGTLALAKLSDVDLVTQWMVDFAVEVLPADEQSTIEKRKPWVLQGIEKQFIHFWIVNDEVVSVACFNRPTKNGITISFVYTPPEHRKKGYGSAVTAALLDKALRSGKKFCTIYTDRTNATSNKIYQDIGFKRLINSKMIILDFKD